MTCLVKQTPAEMPASSIVGLVPPSFLIFFFHVVPLRFGQAESFATPAVRDISHTSNRSVLMRIYDLAFRVKHGVANMDEFDNAND